MENDAKFVQIATARAPLQQRDANTLLELRDGLSDGGLRKMAFLRCSPHATQMANALEQLEMPDACQHVPLLRRHVIHI